MTNQRWANQANLEFIRQFRLTIHLAPDLRRMIKKFYQMRRYVRRHNQPLRYLKDGRFVLRREIQ